MNISTVKNPAGAFSLVPTPERESRDFISLIRIMGNPLLNKLAGDSALN